MRVKRLGHAPELLADYFGVPAGELSGLAIDDQGYPSRVTSPH
jgi:hypothetical protein